MKSAMATRKGIHISGHYVVSINAMPFHIRTLNSEKLKGRTESYVIVFFLQLNDHPVRCFNFGLRRFHLNGCRFELNFSKIKSKTKTLLRIKINTMKGSFSHFNFRPLRSSPIYEQVFFPSLYQQYLEKSCFCWGPGSISDRSLSRQQYPKGLLTRKTKFSDENGYRDIYIYI